MKRPDGFDRVPEPPERRPSSRPEQEPARVPEPASETEAPVEAAPDAAELAPTVDLTEVRKRRFGAPAAVREPDPVRAAERRMRAATRRVRQRDRREGRRFASAARRRRRAWLISGGAVIALAVFVTVGVFTPLMSVRVVEVTGATAVNPADVQQALGHLSGSPLALVDEGDVQRALEPFPLIERYAIERIPPHTLLVRIEERTPVVSIERDGAYQQVDAAGVLVGTAEAPPVGAPVAEGRVVDLDSDAFASAARVLRDMPPSLREQVATVTAASGQDVTMTLASGVQVMWGGAEDTARKAVVLNTMMSSLAGAPVSYIDVSSSEAPVFR